MKTSKYPLLGKLDNEFVENILSKIITKYTVIQIFYNTRKNSKASTVIIHLERTCDADELRSQQWIKKVHQQYQMNICFVCFIKLHDQYAVGHPLIEAFCRRDVVH